MAGNVFGQIFRLITFGESHGPAIGGVLEGCPADLAVDEDFINSELSRRSAGTGIAASGRQEEDRPEFLSGIHDGRTTGGPIAFLIRNRDQRPGDYEDIRDVYRPSHADYTLEMKYGKRSAAGGGRLSGRETAARVVAGAIAKMLLRDHDIHIMAFTSEIGPLGLTMSPEKIDPSGALNTPLWCPDQELTGQMLIYIEELRKTGDTTGGVVQCIISHVPHGLGEPVFDKLHAELGKAVLSIGACRGFEIGTGFAASAMKGSEHNDRFVCEEGVIRTETNRSGGIQGGISNGMDIWFRAAFKPVPSIQGKQNTLDRTGKPREITISGRHDVCVLPRVIPVVEAMAALVMADHLLRHRSSRL